MTCVFTKAERATGHGNEQLNTMFAHGRCIYLGDQTRYVNTEGWMNNKILIVYLNNNMLTIFFAVTAQFVSRRFLNESGCSHQFCPRAGEPGCSKHL